MGSYQVLSHWESKDKTTCSYKYVSDVFILIRNCKHDLQKSERPHQKYDNYQGKVIMWPCAESFCLPQQSQGRSKCPILDYAQ